MCIVYYANLWNAARGLGRVLSLELASVWLSFVFLKPRLEM